jgi:hypothetical protein
MFVPLAKVSFCDRELAVCAVPKLYPSITTSEVRANQLGPMFDILLDDKISRLKGADGQECQIEIKNRHVVKTLLYLTFTL